jgi:HAE1 family hydrophobic/amphiphilic exporter-1
MQWLASLCVRRPIFTWVLMLALLVVGIVGYRALGLDQFPKIDFPTILVAAHLDGAAPEEVETELTDKIEGAVNTLSGIDDLRSRSSEGVSQVIITFTLDKNADVAAQEVRDHINNVLPDLPKGIDQPVVSKIDPDAIPVLYVNLTGQASIRDLTELADKRVRRQIESISGVGQVSIVGGRKRQVNIWLDPVALQASGLTASDISRAVATQNLTVPGGEIETGPRQVTLRVEGRVPTVDSVGRIIVRESKDHPTRISDVARVEDGSEEEETWASENGAQTIVLSVRKQSGENTVAVVDSVKDRLADVVKTLPPGMNLRVVRDNSASIRTSVDAVKEHLVLGAAFAALVVLVFLGNWRSTIIAALAIPISIVGTFAIMWAMGFTLNMITLLALALAVGIVIDDAIVVLENIVRFLEEKNLKPFPAAVLATRDIGLPVLATTLSLLAVFLPVSFMGGIVGRFLNSFGLTMAFAIAVSLFVSFSLTPMLAARWLKTHPSPTLQDADVANQRPGKPILERVVQVFYRPIEAAYLVVLRGVMNHRWIIVVLSGLTLASCGPLMKAVPKGFIPENDDAQFEVNVRAPEGTSLLQTRLIAERIAREIRQEIPSVDRTLLTIGDNEQKTPNLAKIYVKLVDPHDRHDTQLQLMTRTRNEVVARQPKGLRIDVSEVSAISAGQSTATVQYTINGPDLSRLATYTQLIVERLRKVPGAVDVDSSLIVGKPELDVAVDRERAANLGVDVADVANTLQLLVGGLKVGTFEDRGEDYDIYSRAEKSYRADPDHLSAITVPSKTNGMVPLSSVIKLRNATGPAEIDRLARQRQVTVTSNVGSGYGESDVASALEKIISDLHMPPEYRASPAGRSRETGRAARNFLIAFMMSFVFMYLVLAAQFESWLHPVTILLCLPLTIPFALVSLLMLRQQLTIFSALGMLVLFGVVKKNSILQIDHTNKLRSEGKPRLEAIIEANRDRLRPILMTTLAFVAGMVPLIFSRGVGAGFSRATAGVVIGGQSLSLLLTLLATPVAYSLFDDAAVWMKKTVRRGVPEDRGAADLDRLDGLPPDHAPGAAEE